MAEESFDRRAVQEQVVVAAMHVFDGGGSLHGDDQCSQSRGTGESQASGQGDDVAHVALTPGGDEFHGQEVVVGSGADLKSRPWWWLQGLG